MSTKKIDVTKTGMTPNQADHIMMAVTGAMEALWQLEALTKAIMNETKSNDGSTVHQLAKLGNYHAMDQSNLTDCMIDAIKIGEVK